MLMTSLILSAMIGPMELSGFAVKGAWRLSAFGVNHNIWL
jgi:hypothetical protein